MRVVLPHGAPLPFGEIRTPILPVVSLVLAALQQTRALFRVLLQTHRRHGDFSVRGRIIGFGNAALFATWKLGRCMASLQVVEDFLQRLPFKDNSMLSVIAWPAALVDIAGPTILPLRCSIKAGRSAGWKRLFHGCKLCATSPFCAPNTFSQHFILWPRHALWRHHA